MITGRATIAQLLALAGFTAVPGLGQLPLEFTPGRSHPIPSAKNGQRRAQRAAAKRRNRARGRRAKR